MSLGPFADVRPAGVIPVFYPMVKCGNAATYTFPHYGDPLSGGDRERPRRLRRRGGAGAKRVQIPSEGVQGLPPRFFGAARSTRLAWGASDPATGGADP